METRRVFPKGRIGNVLSDEGNDQNRHDGSRIADDVHCPCGILIWDSFWRREEARTLMEFIPFFYQVAQNLCPFKFNSHQCQTKNIRTILSLNRGSTSSSSSSHLLLQFPTHTCLLLMANLTAKEEPDIIPNVASHHSRPPGRMTGCYSLCVSVCLQRKVDKFPTLIRTHSSYFLLFRHSPFSHTFFLPSSFMRNHVQRNTCLSLSSFPLIQAFRERHFLQS